MNTKMPDSRPNTLTITIVSLCSPKMDAEVLTSEPFKGTPSGNSVSADVVKLQ